MAEKDFKARVESFIKEYGELTKKYNVDFANYPVFVPDGNGGFKIVIQNTPVDLNLAKLNDSFIAK